MNNEKKVNVIEKVKTNKKAKYGVIGAGIGLLAVTGGIIAKTVLKSKDVAKEVIKEVK